MMRLSVSTEVEAYRIVQVPTAATWDTSIALYGVLVDQNGS